jgi:predicted GH43/DUF377 family glycosyl hydrolase
MKKGLFVRNPNNPLITTKDLPYQANAVFNAGAADLGDEVLLLLRVESCSGRSHLIVARSKDGVGGVARGRLCPDSSSSGILQ